LRGRAPLFAGSPILVDYAAQFTDRDLNLVLGEMLPDFSDQDMTEFWDGVEVATVWMIFKCVSENEGHISSEAADG
jgi:hypothetical protein